MQASVLSPKYEVNLVFRGQDTSHISVKDM